MKRHGLIADGSFWYTPSRRMFTYQYNRQWIVYEAEISADGHPIDGGNDDLFGCYPRLADAAAAMTRWETAP